MKYIKLSLVFAAIFVFAVACTVSTSTTTTSDNKAAANKPAANTNAPATNTAPPADELASAKKIYSEKCVNCHKADGTGGEVDLEGDKLKVPSYKSDKALKLDDAKMASIIADGDDEMPAFGKKLSETEIKDLVKMIRKDFQGK